MKYLVQAILIDGNIETVIDSIKTDDDRATVEWLMRRHKNNPHYRYVVMDIATQEILINTTRNIFGW
jgi:hypothetical protein